MFDRFRTRLAALIAPPAAPSSPQARPLVAADLPTPQQRLDQLKKEHARIQQQIKASEQWQRLVYLEGAIDALATEATRQELHN